MIDMIFFDVWEGFIPEWVPIWGGSYYSTPIFNIADSCIFIGVCLILFFQRRFFGEPPVEDSFLPDDGPDASEAAVLPTAELLSDEELARDHDQPDGQANHPVDQPTQPESALPQDND